MKVADQCVLPSVEEVGRLREWLGLNHNQTETIDFRAVGFVKKAAGVDLSHSVLIVADCFVRSGNANTENQYIELNMQLSSHTYQRIMPILHCFC